MKERRKGRASLLRAYKSLRLLKQKFPDEWNRSRHRFVIKASKKSSLPYRYVEELAEKIDANQEASV